MVKQRKNILERMTLAADLPSEPVPGVTLVELAGENRVLVENHRGVTEYGCGEIRVCASYGHLCVCGTGLEIARMTKYQMVITGKIEHVSLHRGRK